MTQIVTIVQARMNSTRLPGKIMLPLVGRPLLLRMIERVSLSALRGKIVVATTTSLADDAVCKLCAENNISFFRGNENDLLDRHYQAAKEYRADIVLKIPSDCPLICPDIIDNVIAYYLNHRDEFDFVSNLHPESYPYGNDVELMTMSALKAAWFNADRSLEREHTTPYIWENPERFRLGNVTWETGLDYSKTHRWTIDYREDYEFIRNVYEALYINNPAFSLNDIIDYVALNPEVAEINLMHHGVTWYRNHLHELRSMSTEEKDLLQKIYDRVGN